MPPGLWPQVETDRGPTGTYVSLHIITVRYFTKKSTITFSTDRCTLSIISILSFLGRPQTVIQ